jgi:hypothetical protein
MSLAMAIPQVSQQMYKAPDLRREAWLYMWRRFRVTDADFQVLLEWIGENRRKDRSIQFMHTMGMNWSRWTSRGGFKMAQCGKHVIIQLIEQNPKTNSYWAFLARTGSQVWQVYINNRPVGVVVDGYLIIY